MAFFAASPINVIKPICAYTLFDIFGNKINVRIDPKAPIGTANNTEKGTDQLSYNAARNRNTKTMEMAKKDAKKARKAAEALEKTQKEIEKLQKQIAEDEAKLATLPPVTPQGN